MVVTEVRLYLLDSTSTNIPPPQHLKKIHPWGVCVCVREHVYVCIYVCLCMYMHVCTFVYVCACVCMCVLVCARACACIYVTMCAHVCVSVRVCTCMHAYVRVCACMCAHVCVHMCVCTCMHMYVCVNVSCVCICVCVCTYTGICVWYVVEVRGCTWGTERGSSWPLTPHISLGGLNYHYTPSFVLRHHTISLGRIYL